MDGWIFHDSKKVVGSIPGPEDFLCGFSTGPPVSFHSQKTCTRVKLGTLNCVGVSANACFVFFAAGMTTSGCNPIFC